MILSGTGFHKGIPEYSKHNSPSSMTGDHTMMGRVPERMTSNSNNLWTVLPRPPCRVTLGPVSLSLPDFGLEGASLTIWTSFSRHSAAVSWPEEGGGAASAQGLIAKIKVS